MACSESEYLLSLARGNLTSLCDVAAESGCHGSAGWCDKKRKSVERGATLPEPTGLNQSDADMQWSNMTTVGGHANSNGSFSCVFFFASEAPVQTTKSRGRGGRPPTLRPRGRPPTRFPQLGKPGRLLRSDAESAGAICAQCPQKVKTNVSFH